MLWANSRYCMGEVSKETLPPHEDLAWKETFVQDRWCGGRSYCILLAVSFFLVSKCIWLCLCFILVMLFLWIYACMVWIESWDQVLTYYAKWNFLCVHLMCSFLGSKIHLSRGYFENWWQISMEQRRGTCCPQASATGLPAQSMIIKTQEHVQILISNHTCKEHRLQRREAGKMKSLIGSQLVGVALKNPDLQMRWIISVNVLHLHPFQKCSHQCT